MNALTRSKIETSLANFSSGMRLEVLPEKEREELEEYSKILKVPKKTVLYSEGESPKGIYILLKGKVKVSQLNYDGSIQILFIITTGEVIGYRTVLGSDRHPVTATTLEPCELMYIEKDHFLKVLGHSQKLSNILLQTASHDYTVFVNRINIFAQRGIKERLALFLLLLNQIYRVPGQSGDEAEIKVTRSDLASYTGTSIENLVRTVKVFREKGYITTNGKSIFIRDFEALYAMSGIL